MRLNRPSLLSKGVSVTALGPGRNLSPNVKHRRASAGRLGPFWLLSHDEALGRQARDLLQRTVLDNGAQEMKHIIVEN